MTFKTALVKYTCAALTLDQAELLVIYTVPSAKTFLLKELILNVVKWTATGKINLYILKSGGVDFTTAVLTGAGVGAYTRAGLETTLPDVSIQLSADLGAVGLTVLARNSVLNAGDSIKLFDGAASALAAGAIMCTVKVSGDEF